jgi:hypothetical protein
MLFHFRDKFPQLSPYWDKYMPLQQRMEVAAKTVLLEEGSISGHYIFVEKGCIRLAFNNNGTDKTVQFFLRTKD